MGRIALLALVLLCACAFDAGDGFTTVTEAHLEMEPAPEPLVTDLGYEVRFDAAAVTVASITVEAAGDGSTEEDEDEAGHTHGEEEGDSVDALDPTPVLALPVNRRLDWTAAEITELPEILPAPELSRGTLVEAEATLLRMRIEASVTHPSPEVLGGETVALTVAVTPDEVHTPLDFEVDEQSPREVELHASLRIHSEAFDGLHFAVLREGGELTVTTADHPAAPRMLEAFREAALRVSIE